MSHAHKPDRQCLKSSSFAVSTHPSSTPQIPEISFNGLPTETESHLFQIPKFPTVELIPSPRDDTSVFSTGSAGPQYILPPEQRSLSKSFAYGSYPGDLSPQSFDGVSTTASLKANKQTHRDRAALSYREHNVSLKHRESKEFSTRWSSDDEPNPISILSSPGRKENSMSRIDGRSRYRQSSRPLRRNSATSPNVPPQFEDVREPGSLPISIAIGTWNTEYQSFDLDDFMVTNDSSFGSIPTQRSTSPFMQFIPNPVRFRSPKPVRQTAGSDDAPHFGCPVPAKSFERIPTAEYDAYTTVVKPVEVLTKERHFSSSIVGTSDGTSSTNSLDDNIGCCVDLLSSGVINDSTSLEESDDRRSGDNGDTSPLVASREQRDDDIFDSDAIWSQCYQSRDSPSNGDSAVTSSLNGMGSGVDEVQKSQGGRTPQSRLEQNLKDSKKSRKFFNKDEPLLDWLKPGYDIYVIALQEILSASKLFQAIDEYLNRIHPDRVFLLVREKQNDICGRGDGAYLKTKSTSLVVFVAEDALSVKGGHVKLGFSRNTDLSGIRGGAGSKGAVSVLLSIFNQLVCFIGCHLPACSPEDRLAARYYIRQRLSEMYCGRRDVSIDDVFHHIGDFNFRVQETGIKKASKYLLMKKTRELFSFDELKYADYAIDLSEAGFEEPPVTFLPTYKKLAGRPPLCLSMKDHPNTWPIEEYVVNYKQRWYKGGKIKQSIPSWCDRVFKWSHPALKSCLRFRPGTYSAVQPTVYSILSSADHNPVSCVIDLFPLNSKYRPPVLLSSFNFAGAGSCTMERRLLSEQKKKLALKSNNTNGLFPRFHTSNASPFSKNESIQMERVPNDERRRMSVSILPSCRQMMLQPNKTTSRCDGDVSIRSTESFQMDLEQSPSSRSAFPSSSPILESMNYFVASSRRLSTPSPVTILPSFTVFKREAESRSPSPVLFFVEPTTELQEDSPDETSQKSISRNRRRDSVKQEDRRKESRRHGDRRREERRPHENMASRVSEHGRIRQEDGLILSDEDESPISIDSPLSISFTYQHTDGPHIPIDRQGRKEKEESKKGSEKSRDASLIPSRNNHPREEQSRRSKNRASRHLDDRCVRKSYSACSD